VGVRLASLSELGVPCTFLLLLWKKRKANKFRNIFVLILLDLYFDIYLYKMS